MKHTRFAQRIRLIIATISVLALPLVLVSGVSAQASTQTERATRTWQVQVGQESANQAIQGMAFLPGMIWVNVGDKVTWTANAAEIHTVTFLAKGHELTPFDPFDPTQLFRQGGRHYDGVSYYNSGIMTNVSDSGFPASRTYSLTFDKAGTFTYWCLVHGTMMKGVVKVRATGTHYPFSQGQYDRQSVEKTARILADGRRLWARTAEHASNSTVFAGADDGVAMVMRFIRPTVHVRVGQSVTFRNVGMAAPHTVTFGTEKANIFAPYGDPSHFKGGQLNSGIIEPGGSFTVKFTKAGTYPYVCALHDYMGMVGTVVVG
jgi:plastocyanin